MYLKISFRERERKNSNNHIEKPWTVFATSNISCGRRENTRKFNNGIILSNSSSGSKYTSLFYTIKIEIEMELNKLRLNQNRVTGKTKTNKYPCVCAYTEITGNSRTTNK